MMTSLTWLCLVTTSWAQLAIASRCILYHELSMTKFEDRLNADAFFGYAVTHDQRYSRLLISAPLADNIGLVYHCDIESRSCSNFSRNIINDTIHNRHKQNFWLGATIKSTPDLTMTCAPLYSEYNSLKKHYANNGKCYIINGEKISNTMKISDDTKDLRFEQKMLTFGWSMDIADKTAVIGGPAMYKGRVMVMNLKQATSRPTIAAGKLTDYNFGYSVVAGKFLSPKSIVFAVGSTYGRAGHGQVIFYNQKLELIRMLSKGVDQNIVGSMFGAVLCAANIKDRSSHDILVGAPTYAKDSQYNVGAVYVYLNDQNKVNIQIYQTTIVGQKDGSYFGSAIATVGDLNCDGKDEIAISAPYEDDGRGAVYIYSGYDIINDAKITWNQRIQPENYRAFGLSITALQDYDENGCNELAIGAPESNAVVLLRCMASIIVSPYAVFPNLQNRNTSVKYDPVSKEAYFVFQSCVKVQYPKKPTKIKADLRVRVEINHIDAKLARPAEDSVYQVSFNKTQNTICRNIDVILPKTGNYGVDIGYKISLALQNSPLNSLKFDASRVVLSDRSQLTTVGSVWAAECKDQCKANLKLIEPVKYETKYIIGSTDSKNISIVVGNEGEIAYMACVIVRVGHDNDLISIKRAPALGCEQADEREVKCKPQQPIRTNGSWNVGVIELDTSRLTNKDKSINFVIDMYDDCKNTSVANRVVTEIPLKSDDRSITVKKVADIYQVTKTDVNVIGKRLEQKYILKNVGPTNFMEVRCGFLFDMPPFIKYLENPVADISSVNANVTWNKSFEENKKLISTGAIERLSKGYEITFLVVMDLIPGTLLDMVEDSNVTVSSTFFVKLDYGLIEETIVTTIVLHDPETPIWVIIVAALFGLLIILIFIFILRECGFLTRKNKQELKRVRASVRRQTIRRSMMQMQRHHDEAEQPLHLDITEESDLNNVFQNN